MNRQMSPSPEETEEFERKGFDLTETGINYSLSITLLDQESNHTGLRSMQQEEKKKKKKDNLTFKF